MKRLKKIDLHVHATKTRGLPRENGENMPIPSELMEMYRVLGIEKGVLLPEINVECAYDTATNREVHEIASEYPETFSWFCNIDPRQGSNSPQTDFSHFLRYYKGLGAKGVGEISANVYFDDPRLLNLFAHCEAFDMPVLFHIGNLGGDYGIVDDFGLKRLEKVLHMFPRLTVIGHSQKFWSAISGDVTPEQWNGYPKGKIAPGGRVVELMENYPNLHCDLSAGSGYNAITRDVEFSYRFLETFQDRIFFGTDICSPTNIHAPMVRLAAFLDAAMETHNISYAAYEKISRGNALKLLNR